MNLVRCFFHECNPIGMVQHHLCAKMEMNSQFSRVVFFCPTNINRYCIAHSQTIKACNVHLFKQWTRRVIKRASLQPPINEEKAGAAKFACIGWLRLRACRPPNARYGAWSPSVRKRNHVINFNPVDALDQREKMNNLHCIGTSTMSRFVRETKSP